MVEELLGHNSIPADTETDRTCGCCGALKVMNEFYKDGTNRDGSPKYRRDCKDCYNMTRNSERKNKKTPLPKRRK